MEQSFANDNVINGNNETIEICINDNFGPKQKQVGIQKMVVKK